MPADLPGSEFCLPGSDLGISLGTSTISGLTYFDNLELPLQIAYLKIHYKNILYGLYLGLIVK